MVQIPISADTEPELQCFSLKLSEEIAHKLAEAETRSEIALNQPRRQQSFAGIAERKGSRTPDTSVTRQIGDEGRNHRADSDRPSSSGPDRDQHAG